jgi:hypothetical protein
VGLKGLLLICMHRRVAASGLASRIIPHSVAGLYAKT